MKAASAPAREELSVAEVLDAVKADHHGEVIDSAAAEMLVTLIEGVIRGSQARGRSRWAAVVGPVVKPGVAAKLLDISATALSKRRDAAAVLGVRTESGRWVYPLDQFRVGDRGVVEILPGLRAVLTELLAAVDGLGAARWLATPHRRLGASTPWEALGDDSGRFDVAAAARAQAAEWAGR